MAGPRLVLLDLNHWIYLAKAYWGIPHKPNHAEVSDRILRRVLRDEIRLPLNVMHLIEHLRNESADRRARLAEVLEHFSAGWFFTPWSEVIPRELEMAVQSIFEPQPSDAPLAVVGQGYLWSRGRELLPSHWTDDDIERMRRLSAEPGQLYELLTFPNDHGHGRLRQGIAASNEANRKAAEDLRSRRRPYPKDIQRRAQYATYMVDNEALLASLLAKTNHSIDDLLALGVDGLCDFWRSASSLDVDCELTLYRDRQWSRAVERNDVFDIGHLALGIPYCDAVVTERLWARAIEETGLATKYSASVFTDIAALTDWVDNVPPADENCSAIDPSQVE